MFGPRLIGVCALYIKKPHCGMEPQCGYFLTLVVGKVRGLRGGGALCRRLLRGQLRGRYYSATAFGIFSRLQITNFDVFLF